MAARYHTIGVHVVGTVGGSLPNATGSWARLAAPSTNTAAVELFDTGGGSLGNGFPIPPGADTGWFRINANLNELAANAIDADDQLRYWVRP